MHNANFGIFVSCMVREIFAFSCTDTVRPDFEKITFIWVKIYLKKVDPPSTSFRGVNSFNATLIRFCTTWRQVIYLRELDHFRKMNWNLKLDSLATRKIFHKVIVICCDWKLIKLIHTNLTLERILEFNWYHIFFGSLPNKTPCNTIFVPVRCRGTQNAFMTHTFVPVLCRGR